MRFVRDKAYRRPLSYPILSKDRAPRRKYLFDAEARARILQLLDDDGDGDEE